MPSFHGATFGAIAMNGDLDAPALFGPFATFSEKIPAPLTYRSESPEAAARITAKALEETIARIGGENVLAFVCEPVGGQSSGANVPDPLFFSEVRASATSTASTSSTTRSCRPCAAASSSPRTSSPTPCPTSS